MPLRSRSCRSLTNPANRTVCPLAIAIELLTLRCDTVGVSVPVEAVVETELISCSMSSNTLPLALILGATRKMTPVLR